MFLLGLLFVGVGIFGFLRLQLVELLHVKPQGGVYSEGVQGDFTTLHPLFTPPGSPESDIESLIFSGLIRYDANQGTYIPDLAESFTVSDDFKTYDFVLRNSIKWHDSKAFSMDDVVYTYDLLKNESLVSPWKSVFSHVTYELGSDGNHIIFRIPDTDRFFLQSFQFPILPKHILESIPLEEQQGSYFAEHPVGTGPFRLLDLVRLNKYDLVQLKYYNKFQLNWDTHIQFIDFYFYNELTDLKNSTLSAYRSSLFEFPPSDYTNQTLSLPFYETLFFNLENDGVAKKEVRLAIAMMLRLFQKELEEVSMLDVFKGEESYDDDENFVRNHTKEEVEEKIRELLYQGGWQLYTKEFDDGIRRNTAREKLSLRIASLDAPKFTNRVEQVKKLLEQYGIEVQTDLLPWVSLLTDSIYQKKYDLLLLNIEVPEGPDYFPYLHSSSRNLISQGKNYSQFQDFEVDVLLEDLKMSMTSEKHDKVLIELEKRYDEFIPFIPLSKPGYTYLLRNNISGCNIPEKPLHLSDRFWNFKDCYVK